MSARPDLQPIPIESIPRLSLREAEAAEALGVSPSWLRREAHAGTIPSVRVAGARLYPVDALRRWLAERAEGEQASDD